MERAQTYVNRLVSVIWQTLKTAGTVWLVLFFEPWLEKVLPGVHEGWRYLVVALVGALVIEAGDRYIFGWPVIDVRWMEGKEYVETTTLVARISSDTKASQVFDVVVSTRQAGLLTYWLFRLFTKHGLNMQIKMERMDATPMVEDSTRERRRGSANQIRKIPTVLPDAETCGFNITLGEAPERPGTWHWAAVRWEPDAMKEEIELNIDYVLLHKNPFVRFWAKFIWKSKNVDKIRVVEK